MKKIAFFTLLIFFIVSAVACSEVPEDALFFYDETENGLIITGVNAHARELIIPDSINGMPVVAIAENAFYRNERIRKVTIPSSVKDIGAHAFADCPNLNSVIFEKNGTISLSDSVFENCKLLSTVRFNSSIVSIGDGTFRNCGRIFKISIGKEVKLIGHEAFKGCERALFDIQDNSYASAYATKNHLAVSFTDSIYFIYFQFILITLGLVLLFVGYKIYKKRKKK